MDRGEELADHFQQVVRVRREGAASTNTPVASTNAGTIRPDITATGISVQLIAVGKVADAHAAVERHRGRPDCCRCQLRVSGASPDVMGFGERPTAGGVNARSTSGSSCHPGVLGNFTPRMTRRYLR